MSSPERLKDGGGELNRLFATGKHSRAMPEQARARLLRSLRIAGLCLRT